MVRQKAVVALGTCKCQIWRLRASVWHADADHFSASACDDVTEAAYWYVIGLESRATQFSHHQK